MLNIGVTIGSFSALLIKKYIWEKNFLENNLEIILIY